jgi:chromosome segregation ATPase
MPRGLVLLNTTGVFVLAVLVAVQWWDNRAEHERFMTENHARQEAESQLSDTKKRVASLEGDVERLKAGLADAQKAADEASTARTKLEGDLKVMTAERDQLKTELAKWQAAVKDRDGRIATLSAQLRETRAKLDEAVQRLEGKKKE